MGETTHIDDRGVSEVVGFTLLLGMVLLAGLTLFLVSGMAKDQIKEQSRVSAAEDQMQETDSELGSLSRGGVNESTVVEFGRNEGSIEVVQSGSVEFTVNGHARCRASVRMSSMRYSDVGDTTVAYEAGGVWKRTEDGGVVMVSPPELTYRDGRATFAVMNMSGEVDGNAHRVRASRTGTGEAVSQAIRRALYGAQGCRVPSNVTIDITSDYYEAWGSYLEQEFVGAPGVSVSTFDANSTARVYYETDITRPTVVNFSTNRANAVDSNNSLVVRTDHPANVSVLGTQTSHNNRTTIVNTTLAPVDAILTMDESGSMVRPPSKLQNIKTAAMEGFMPVLNGSMRAGLVGYNSTRYRFTTTVHQELTTDRAAVNDSITDLTGDGSTPIGLGLHESIDQLLSDSNSSRARIIVLLSDGRNRGGPDPRAAARRAARNNITVYTIGYGAGADMGLMDYIANETGGFSRYAENASSLKQDFRNIVEDASTTQLYYRDHPPITASMDNNGTTYRLRPDGTLVPGSVAPTVDNLNRFIGTGNDLHYNTTRMDSGAVGIRAVSWYCQQYDETGRYTPPIGGNSYLHRLCDRANASATYQDTDITQNRMLFLTNGEAIPSGTNVPRWQRELEPFLRDLQDGRPFEVTSSGRVRMCENQVLVVANLPANATATDGYQNVVMLYEAGTGPCELDYSPLEVQVTDVNVSEAGGARA